MSRLLRSTAMRRGLKGLIAVLLAGSACLDPSFAFQERSLGDASDRPAGLPSALELSGLNLKTPEPGSGVGTEIRVPGVGTVGTLPKLDFGLELLYGAAEQKGLTPEDRGHPEQNDLQIRGTIKHRF